MGEGRGGGWRQIIRVNRGSASVGFRLDGTFPSDWYHPGMRVPSTAKQIRQTVWELAWIVLLALLLTGSTLDSHDQESRMRRVTRASEFDFAGWTLAAIGVKVEQSSLGYSGYLPTTDQQALIREFLELTREVGELETRQLELTADPASPGLGLDGAHNERAEIEKRRERLAILQLQSETVLQEQEAVILAEMGLDVGGLPLPPVLFHFTRLPLSVIVSPRNVIRQDASIQLDPDLTLQQQVSLESLLEASLGVSALVVPLGGIGTYPTMVQESSSLGWIAEVIAHEWAHNYLFFRPLGFLYETNLVSSPELRTMNETAASLFGKAVSERLLERYYPDLRPPGPRSPPASENAPPVFDFRAEMHTTRLEVDSLLAQGKVDQAEAYMEARRRVFWDKGYHIRRLNQAYFAFHGAYADEPGGAAGADPVGEAVRAFWDQSDSPAQFLRQIGRFRTFAELERAIEGRANPTR